MLSTHTRVRACVYSDVVDVIDGETGVTALSGRRVALSAAHLTAMSRLHTSVMCCVSARCVKCACRSLM